MALQTEIPVQELARFVAGDFTVDWLNPNWSGTLEPSPCAGETMRYMLARWAYHVRRCGGGTSTRECMPGCDAHTSEMRAGGPVQYVHQLAANMMREGWKGDPIDVYHKPRMVNDGHHRILAALIARLEMAPIIDYSIRG